MTAPARPMKAAIVVPTIREECIVRFLDAWSSEFTGQEVIVVEDNPERSFEIAGCGIRHYCWADIDAELGENSWIIPRRTDCIRSFGYYRAYQLQPDMIVTLDDDCYPAGPDFLKTHFETLCVPTKSPAWVSTGSGVTPRGVPYDNTQRQAECVISHGLWTNVPDFDAITQIANARFQQPFWPLDQVIPRGKYFPMCGMNLAFKPKIVAVMYFLLMGKSWSFDRFGDIWCGLFAKRICDHLGLSVRSGEPRIEHQRASNPWTNLRKELPGYEANEHLWEVVDSTVLTGTTPAECYRELAEKLPLAGEYWDHLRRAMQLWTRLFAGEAGSQVSEATSVGSSRNG